MRVCWCAGVCGGVTCGPISGGETQEPGSELVLKREDAGISRRSYELKLWVCGQALEGAPPSGLNSFWKWEARSCAKSHAADGAVGEV